MMTNDSQKDCTLYLINCVINKNENEKIINKCNISLSEYAVTGVKKTKSIKIFVFAFWLNSLAEIHNLVKYSDIMRTTSTFTVKLQISRTMCSMYMNKLPYQQMDDP